MTSAGLQPRRGGFTDVVAMLSCGLGVVMLMIGHASWRREDYDSGFLMLCLAAAPLSASVLYAAFSHIDSLIARIVLGLVVVAAVVLLLLGGCLGYLSALDFHGPNTPSDQSRRLAFLAGGLVGLGIVPGFGIAIVLDVVRRWAACR
jgi:uncharacterized membrane protein YfcA